MLSEILDDLPERMTVTNAAQACGANVSTVWRWINRGILINGERVRLQAVRVGGRLFITAESLRRFLTDLNRCSPNESSNPKFDALDRECEERGL